jgi:uncharacterized protein YjaG (DUF416 family)
MAPLQYDEKDLVVRLDRLPSNRRPIFAASCAQRLLPAYAVFSKASNGRFNDRLPEILSLLWDDLEEIRCQQPIDVTRCIDVAIGLIQGDDATEWIPEQAPAENAAEAVAYAFTCRLSGSSQEAAWAARQVYDALDYVLVSRLRIDINNPADTTRIVAHPLVQAELSRQLRDLKNLQQDLPLEQLAAAARHLSTSEAIHEF